MPADWSCTKNNEPRLSLHVTTPLIDAGMRLSAFSPDNSRMADAFVKVCACDSQKGTAAHRANINAIEKRTRSPNSRFGRKIQSSSGRPAPFKIFIERRKLLQIRQCPRAWRLIENHR